TIAELASSVQGVVATGGGAVLREFNRTALRRHFRVFYLRSSAEDLFRRLRHDSKRPLLQVADPLLRLQELYAVRDPLYCSTAHAIIETGRPSVAALVGTIVQQLEIDPQPDS
ncbi:MAG: shikimate kinase, partial [Gammaproteobacteria bacterium]|nr:shikimate kinase [Gammaproteobacteria bacterium]